MNRGCYNIVGTGRVLPKQDEKWVQSNGKQRTYYCKHCVQLFSSEEKSKCHMYRGVTM